MASGISLIETAAADIPTPASGKVTVFVNSDTGEPSYKDDTGTAVSLKGAPGEKGDPGDAGDPGVGVPIGGTAGQVLAKVDGTDYNTEWVDSSSTAPAWGDITGTLSDQTDLQAALGGKQNGLPLTTKGDLLVYDGSAYQRVPVGANGYYLSADSAEALGVKWVAGGGGSSALSDLTDVDIPTPADNEILTYDSVSGTWVAKASAGLSGVNNKFAYLRMSGNQPVPGTIVTLEFGNAIENSDSMWDVVNNRYDIPASMDGKLVNFTVTTQHTADDSGLVETWIELSKDNGSTWVRIGQSPNGGMDQWGITAAFGIVRVATGDWIRYRHYSQVSKIIDYLGGTVATAVVLDTASGGTVGGVNTQTGTNYTLQLTDEEAVVIMDSGSANTVTIPPNSTTAIAVGAKIDVVQKGAGTTTIQGGSGVSIRGISEGHADVSGQWGRVTLQKIGTDLWTLNGDHEAVS